MAKKRIAPRLAAELYELRATSISWEVSSPTRMASVISIDLFLVSSKVWMSS